MMFKLIWKAIVGGNPTSWLVLGLAATIVVGSAFAAGYYKGDTHDAKIVAAATAQAVQAATVAQAKADAEQAAKDRAVAVADALKRGAANQAALDRAAGIKAQIPGILAAQQPKPVNGKCPAPLVPAAAMKLLNDPTLIGDGK
jgi:hypothetical protein